MYESFYNLRSKPFRLSPDPQFFFSSRGHKRALSYLRYGVEQGEGFIVITGDVGTGKTTLAKALFKELSSSDIIAAQMVNTQLEADDMLRSVAAAFGMEHRNLDKAALLKALERYLMAQTREGKRMLLIVDEAQNIPAGSLEELRMLSNFQVGDKALLQSFLLGQQQFRATLQSPDMEQLRQRVIAAYHLSPLALDETRGYIEHRLRTAGWNEDPKFTADAYIKIYQYAGGIPRRINTLCDRLLLFGYLEEMHEIGSDTVSIVANEILGETYAASTAQAEAPGSVQEQEQEQLADDKRDRRAKSEDSEVLRRLRILEKKIDVLDKKLNKDRKRMLKALLSSHEQPAMADNVKPLRRAE